MTKSNIKQLFKPNPALKALDMMVGEWDLPAVAPVITVPP